MANSLAVSSPSFSAMVRDPARREIIGDLAGVMDRLVATKGDDELIRMVEKSRLNLLRMWADT